MHSMLFCLPACLPCCLQLWMTESIFSQYRTACRTLAYDYLMYDSGGGSLTGYGLHGML
jgi:hypothetical protein